MPGRKHSVAEMTHVLERVAERLAWGAQQADVARELDLSPSTICYLQKKNRKHYVELLKKGKNARERLAAEKYFQYERQIQEAYKAWQRSKEDAKRTTTETFTNAEGVVTTKEIETTEGRTGDAKFQSLIKQCRDAQRELLGLDEPKQVVQKNLNLNCNWDAFTLTSEPPKDQIEEQLIRAENGEIIEEIAPPEDPEELPEGSEDLLSSGANPETSSPTSTPLSQEEATEYGLKEIPDGEAND